MIHLDFPPSPIIGYQRGSWTIQAVQGKWCRLTSPSRTSQLMGVLRRGPGRYYRQVASGDFWFRSWIAGVPFPDLTEYLWQQAVQDDVRWQHVAQQSFGWTREHLEAHQALLALAEPPRFQPRGCSFQSIMGRCISIVLEPGEFHCSAHQHY